ncbi:hypothetical protein ACFSTH_17900 [Paenibacillus yanchengensis]|uniref:DUF4405 domain-containing protein n=1 Tax=Paenibacillus yanchengensis TaxID=2035833 RepID=A0ABW4YPF7_9BACL
MSIIRQIVWLRLSATVAIVVGAFYLLFCLGTAKPIVGINTGSGIGIGQTKASLWGIHALCSGILMLICSIFLYRITSKVVQKVVITTITITGILLVFSQITPLLWWTFVNGNAHSPLGILFLGLHLLLLIVSLWQALSFVFSFEPNYQKTSIVVKRDGI